MPRRPQRLILMATAFAVVAAFVNFRVGSSRNARAGSQSLSGSRSSPADDANAQPAPDLSTAYLATEGFRSLSTTRGAASLDEMVAAIMNVDPAERRDLALQLLRSLSTRSLEAKLGEIEALGDIGLRNLLLEALHQVWAERDPIAALASALGFDSEDPAILEAAIAGWSSKYPAAAWQWLASDGRIFATNSLLGVVLEELRQKGSYAESLKLIDSLPDERQRTKAMSEFAAVWVRSRPEEIATMLRQFDGPTGNMVASHVGLALAEEGPPALAAFVQLQDIQSPDLRKALYSGATIRWAGESDYGKIEALLATPGAVSSVEEEDAILDAASLVVTRKDPEGAYALTSRIANSDLRDRSLISAAAQLGNDQPAEAIRFAAAIQDPGQREARMTRVLDRWYASDPAAAAAYAAQADLPATLREKYPTPQ